MAGPGFAAESSLYLETLGAEDLFVWCPKQPSCLVLLFRCALVLAALGGSVGLLRAACHGQKSFRASALPDSKVLNLSSLAECNI